MGKIIQFLLKIVKFIGLYVVFFVVVHYGLLNIVFLIFGKTSGIGLILSAVLDIIAVLGGVLFSLYYVTKKKIASSSDQDNISHPIVTNKKLDNQPMRLDYVVKISIIAGTLIVALSLAYYLVVFLPKKEATRVAEQQQEKLADEQKASEQKEKETAKELEVKTVKCFEDAKRFHESYIKSIIGYYQEPKYNYNQKLGKCLYSGGYNKKTVSFSDANADKLVKTPEYYWERVVKDVYTNETILSAYNFQDTETIKAFWEEHSKLMSN